MASASSTSAIRVVTVVAVALTFGTMILGAWTKAIGAGLACPDWPTCWGEWFPPFEDATGYTTLQVMSEWSHRLFATLVGLASIGMVYFSWPLRKQLPRTFRLSTIVLPLVIFQGLLGALTVNLGNVPWATTMHLTFATITFGVMVAAAIFARVESSPREGSRAGDFIALTKPSILFLLVLVGMVSMVVAAGGFNVPMPIALGTLVGGTLTAAAANVLNNYYDRDIDVTMYRTSKRALPSGRVSPRAAFAYAMVLAVAGTAVLLAFVNWVAAALAIGGILSYILLYTIWLKRNTPQNIVIGGIAGSFPAWVGWAAVTGSLSMPAILLGLLVFLWTPPHFWALALVYKEDYARANVPMMPVVKGEARTKIEMVVYAILLVACSLLLVVPYHAAGVLYFGSAIILGAIFLTMSVAVWRGVGGKPMAYKLFGYSIAYLILLYVAMVADRAILGTNAAPGFP